MQTYYGSYVRTFRTNRTYIGACVAEGAPTLPNVLVPFQEVQNFDGEVLEQMISEINAFIGEDKYEYIAAGTVGRDAIKNSIIYQPALVTPIGSSSILTYTNPSDKSRPSVAQTFENKDSSERFTFVSNHLKSKGSGCAEDNGGSDALEGEGNCGFTRAKHGMMFVVPKPFQGMPAHTLLPMRIRSFWKLARMSMK